jgi:hypothetical protein
MSQLTSGQLMLLEVLVASWLLVFHFHDVLKYDAV